MFSRRHPYLFFILVFSVISASSTLIGMLIITSLKGDVSVAGSDKIGVIEIAGAITDSRKILEDIKSFRTDKNIKAIIVRIDSPGGGVGPSQEIYREIIKTTREKKVIASMGSVAASGGYYIAAATDGIVANPGTITGSIGVIMGYTNFKTLLEKIGLKPVVIKSGAFKDMGSPAREMKDEERKILQDVTDHIHKQFVADISKGRKIDLARVEKIADGRIFTGEQAKDLGLVDRLGNFEDAVQWAGKLGGLKGEIQTIYPKEEKLSFLRYLMETALNDIAHRVKNNADMDVEYRYRPLSQ